MCIRDSAERGLGGQGIQVSEDSLREIAGAADGDVRRALTLLEIAADIAQGEHCLLYTSRCV